MRTRVRVRARVFVCVCDVCVRVYYKYVKGVAVKRDDGPCLIFSRRVQRRNSPSVGAAHRASTRRVKNP